MPEGVQVGRFVVLTEEQRSAESHSDFGAWTSVAFIYDSDDPLRPRAVLTGALGGDALEARRHAVVDAQRYIRVVENNQRRRVTGQYIRKREASG